MVLMDRRRFLHSAVLGGGLTFTLTSRGYGQGALQPLLVAQSVNTIVYATHLAAIETGYLREAGVEMKIITTGGGAKVRDIVAAEQVGFGLGDTTHPLQLSNRGRPSRMLMVTDKRCTYANIVIRSDLFDQGIDTIEKLAAWRRPGGAMPILAATAIGSGTWVYGNYILRQKGIVDKFNWVSGGDTQTMVGGLRSRQFDALMALPAWIFDLEDNGWGKTIFDVRNSDAWNSVFKQDFPATCVYALDSFIARNPELTQNYINAMYRAQKWLLSTPTDELVKVLWRSQLSAFPEEIVRRELDYYKAVFHPTGRFDQAAYEAASPVFFNEDTRIRPIAFTDAVDNRFLDAAEKRYG